MTTRLFDPELLRSFVTGVELGNFAQAADRLGRSTSAVSAQLKRLEEQAGVPLMRKAGRGLEPTQAGHTLLGYARRLLALNEEAAGALQSHRLQGWVRLGLQEDFEPLLAGVLGSFARSHPGVRIEARTGRNAALLERLAHQGLDLALTWGDDTGTGHMERVAQLPLCWVGPAQADVAWQRERGAPLPLVAFEAPCLFLGLAQAALARAGIDSRPAFTSPSLTGLWAATAAGLGWTVRTRMGLPPGVRALEPGECGLPGLPSLSLSLHRLDARPSAAASQLGAILLQAVRAALPADAY